MAFRKNRDRSVVDDVLARTARASSFDPSWDEDSPKGLTVLVLTNTKSNSHARAIRALDSSPRQPGIGKQEKEWIPQSSNKNPPPGS